MSTNVFLITTSYSVETVPDWLCSSVARSSSCTLAEVEEVLNFDVNLFELGVDIAARMISTFVGRVDPYAILLGDWTASGFLFGSLFVGSRADADLKTARPCCG